MAYKSIRELLVSYCATCIYLSVTPVSEFFERSRCHFDTQWHWPLQYSISKRRLIARNAENTLNYKWSLGLKIIRKQHHNFI